MQLKFPDENGMVRVKDLPSADTAVQKALTDNSSALFEEGYNLAKDYMALLVAKGTGEAVAEVMMTLPGSTVSEGSALSDTSRSSAVSET